MAIYINTNVNSLIAQKNLSKAQLAMNKSMERLSTGMRINRAADDATGLALSEGLKAEIASLHQCMRNASDGISLLQVAEGSMGEIGTNLIRLRELAIQSANGTIDSENRMFVQQEFTALLNEIDRIASVTEFAGLSLLNGGASGGVIFQVGADNDMFNQTTVAITDVRTDQLGTTSLLSNQTISTITGAQNTLAVIDESISQIVSERSDISAAHNQLRSAVTNLSTSIENLSAANSRIREVDVASETAELTRAQILIQAGVSILSQANTSPQMALQLLQQ